MGYRPPLLPNFKDQVLNRALNQLQRATESLTTWPTHVWDEVWDDLLVPVTSTVRQGSNDPSFSRYVRDHLGTSQGVFSMEFSATVEQELYFVAQLSHGYKEGSDFAVHVHWGPNTAAAGNVVLGVEYTVAAPKSGFRTTTLATTTAPTALRTPYHDVTNIATIPGKGLTVSSIILGRVYREAANSADTYAGTVFMFNVDFHYLKNSNGSRQEWVK